LSFKTRLSKGQASEKTEAIKEWYYFTSRKHLSSCAQCLKSTDAVKCNWWNDGDKWYFIL